MFYKMFHELIDLDVHELFVISNSNTRGHYFKSKRSSVNNKDKEFSNRSVNVCNSLLDAVVNCKTLSLLKYKLKSCYMDKYCTRIQQYYLYTVICAPISACAVLFMVFCRLSLGSFQLHLVIIFKLSYCRLLSIPNGSSYDTLLAFLGVMPTSLFCHAIRDCQHFLA